MMPSQYCGTPEASRIKTASSRIHTTAPLRWSPRYWTRNGSPVAIERSQEPINIFNLGHAEWISVDESIAIITRALGVAPRLDYGGGERGWVGDSPRILLDTQKIRALGWSPTKTIEQGILDTLEFLKASPYVERRT